MLGPLIVFVCVLVVMVVAGKLIYPAPRGIYLAPPEPRLHHALSRAEVYGAGRLVGRLRPGDAVWVERLENGSAVVFRDQTGREVVGITDALLEQADSLPAPAAR